MALKVTVQYIMLHEGAQQTTELSKQRSSTYKNMGVCLRQYSISSLNQRHMFNVPTTIR